MTAEIKTEDSILSVVLQLVIRTLIVTVIAFSGLALTKHVSANPLILELSAPLLIFPYILYELLATLWSYTDAFGRRLLALGSISVVSVWIYLFREIGIVSLGIVLVLIIAVDFIPVQNMLNAVGDRLSETLEGGKEDFESSPSSMDNDPDTRLYPVDEHGQERNFSEEPSVTYCPDCGCDHSRLLVGRHCPNCGNILKSQNNE